MENLPIATRILISFILGALIGFEREINEKKKIRRDKKPNAILGVRTFSLFAAFGALSGVTFVSHPFFSALLGVVLMVLTIVFYAIESNQTKDPGITTEISLIYSYFLGVFIGLHVIPVQILLALTVVVILLLSKKDSIKRITQDVTRYEINSFIVYAVISLVILPFLPNTSYSLNDITLIKGIMVNLNPAIQQLLIIDMFNPFKLWFIVTLITGMDVLGYILEKTIGQQKGWVLTSIAGGFISSTATTQSMAAQSKKSSDVNILVASALVANIASFFQIAAILVSVNSVYFFRIFPTLVSIILSAICASAFFFFRKTNSKSGKRNMQIIAATHSIIDLSPALKFAGIFLVITMVSKIALQLFGAAGLFITSAVGALAGIDAVLINTADLVGKTVTYEVGVMVFILVNAINLIAKSLYSFAQGKREFAFKLTSSMLFIILSSFLGLLFV